MSHSDIFSPSHGEKSRRSEANFLSWLTELGTFPPGGGGVGGEGVISEDCFRVVRWRTWFELWVRGWLDCFKYMVDDAKL